MESRRLLAAFVVTNTQDTGAGSLRQAILDANTSPGLDRVSFGIPGGGVHTISLASPLPVITDAVDLDATGPDGLTPTIELDGANAGVGASGLVIASSDPVLASSVLGLIINRFNANGIRITGDGNVVGLCYVGADATGAASGAASGATSVAASGAVTTPRSAPASATAFSNGAHGILIDGGDNNTVGDSTLAFNAGDGVAVVDGARGNDVALNSFFSNGGLPIDLANDGPTANDALDADGGPNALQNYPVITSVSLADGGGMVVRGAVSTTPNTELNIVLYAGPGPRENGRRIVDSFSVTTDASGNAAFSRTLGDVAPLDVVASAATALDVAPDGQASSFNTSELSPPPIEPIAPRVTRVFLNGQGLTGGSSSPNRRAFLEAALLDPTYGYPVAGVWGQHRPFPWINGVNSIAIRFDEDVQVGHDDLALRGVNSRAYAVESFAYDRASHTAVWTLAAAVTNDRVRLVLDSDPHAGVRGSRSGLPLDGEWLNNTDSFPSGDGTPGGDFDFLFNVLAGDATLDGKVDALDLAYVRQGLNRTASVPGANGQYTAFKDVTADGVLNALDVSAVKQRLNRRLPDGSPASVLFVAHVPPLRS